MRIQPSRPRIPRWALYGGTCVVTMAVTAWVQLSDKRDVVTLAQPSGAAAPALTAAMPQRPLDTAAPLGMPVSQPPMQPSAQPSTQPSTQATPSNVLPAVVPGGTTTASPVVGTNGFAQPAPEAPAADADSERAGN